MKQLRSQQGQMTIEAILLLSIMVIVFTIVHRRFNSEDYLAKMVRGPWSIVQGMIENGVWQSAEQGKRFHPNNYARRASPEPL